MAAAGYELVHATAIAVAGSCALLRGASGSGKSDLALRCLTLGSSPLLPHTAALVSDDQVLLRREGGLVIASAPASIAGLLEIRGVGIARLPVSAEAEVRLVVELCDSPAVERLPPGDDATLLLGSRLPVLKVHPFEASAPAKVLIALARVTGSVAFEA